MPDDKVQVKTLAEILDREFSRLVSTPSKFKREHQFDIAEQAKFLKIDRTTLGRFRSNTRPLPRKRALKFAELLRRGATVEEIQSLADQLFAASQAGAAEDQIAVEEWFDRGELRESLLLVEFREPPALRPDGKHEDLVAAVADAIVSGLCYAMLFPFSTTLHPRPKVTFYLDDVLKTVRRTYDAILESVIHQTMANQPGDDDGALDAATRQHRLDSALAAATNRLRLYKLKPVPELPGGRSPDFCPGIGDRLFYVRYPHRIEQWLWVTVGGKTTMILRDTDPLKLEAQVDRYSPILDCWGQNHHLPAADELVEIQSKTLAESQWEPVDTRSLREIMDDFRKAQEAKKAEENKEGVQ